MPTKIFYVEDELALAAIVKDTLEIKGFEVEHYSDGAKAVSALNSLNADICILDVMLPHVDGFEIGKRISNIHPSIPIIYLTAKNQTKDVLEGFKSGGRDYVRKPFSIEELEARINNLLDQKKTATPVGTLMIGSFEFDYNKLRLSLGKEHIKLTHREAQIILEFAQHKNDVIHKKDLLLKIWGDDGYYNSRSLDVYIKKLRTYFAQDSDIEILTLRGIGYRINISS